MADIESITPHDLAEIKTALLKAPQARSYDDLLLLKSYITKTEFYTKNLSGIANPKQMNDICRGMTLETFAANEVVFSQGDVGDKIYVLLSGSCEVRIKYKIDLTQGETETREKLIVTYHNGQYFGERALHNDEPRTATVISKTESDLVSVSKFVYLNVLSDAKREAAMGSPSKDNLGTKESVIALLSKMREKRTNQELDAVAAYLWRRIPFFQKFTPTQLIELCRVAETVSIWGKSILFKQGQIGQAFYVILTGSVEVWVQDANAEPMVERKPVAPTGKPDLLEDLGIKVNQLVSGDVFGERALESESSKRMASISTCEDLTELLVIAKEDYHNLVYVMMHADSMQRLTLLRKTELFRSVDVVHLKALARFMEPRKYAIDEPLFIAGRKAVEMIIIDVGECRAETVIREGFEKMTEEEKREFHSKHYMQATHDDHDSRQPHHRHYDLYDHSHPLDAHKKRIEDQHGHHHHHGHHDHVHPHQGTGGNPHHVEIHYPTPHKVSTVPPSEHDKHYVAHLDFRQDSFHHSNVDFLHHRHAHEHHLPSIHEHTSHSHPHDNSKTHGTNHPSSGHDKHHQDHHHNNKEKDDDERSTASLISIDDLVKSKLKRINTSDLIPFGDLKTVNLGRIAPASVLATYITKCETIHNEVYHPETVVASTLVTAYTIGKHDFFNHMPRDTRLALVKIIAEFKTPMLSSLWENVPRILDEDEWKKSKTWEIYIDQVVHAKKDANIYNTYQHLSKFHISSNSGNNAQTKIALKNEMLLANTEHLGFHKAKVEVSMDWGLKKSPRLTDAGHTTTTVPLTNTVAVSSSHAPSVVTSAKQSAAPSPLTVSAPPVTNINTLPPVVNTVQQPIIVTAMDGKILPAINEESSLIGKAVSKMIRNRINYSHFSEKILNQNTVQKPGTGMSGMSDASSRPASSNSSLQKSTLSVTTNSRMKDGSVQSITTTNMPFFLIQIHREKSNQSGGVPNLYDANGRSVKCYLRLCGSFPSCASSKESADNQMENVYLTLFKSDASKEKELVLHWMPFKGFDAVPLSDSDHFFIYCRSTPIEYASICPSKNIFNVTFPPLCKKDGQRFSCIVANKLNEIVPIKKEDSLDDNDSLSEVSVKKEPVARQRMRNSVSVTAPTNTASSNNPVEAAQALSNIISPPAPMLSHPQMSTSNLSIMSETIVVAKKQPVVPYMLEFSILNEVLLTTSNRLDCIRFAIQKFGSFSDTDDPLASPTRTLSNSTTGIGGSSSLGQKIYLRKAQSSHSGANATNAANQTVERVLNIANNENKRICVVPLFQWLLVNEDTFKALDFINVFTEEANKSHSAEDSAHAMEDEIARSNRLTGKTKLINSFSEAGFLTTKYATKASADSPEKQRNVKDEDDDEFNNADRAISINRSLHLLEKNLQTQELSKKILRQSRSNQELNKRKPSSPIVAGHNVLGDHSKSVEWGFSRPILPHQDNNNGNEGSRPNTADEIDLTGGVGSIRLEARLKKLNETADMRAQFIANSSKLNDEEHAVMAKNISKSVKVVDSESLTSLSGGNNNINIATNNHKMEQKDIVERIGRRTDVALSIHNMNYTKTSSFPEQQQQQLPSGGHRMSVSLGRVSKNNGFVSSVGIREPAPLQPPGSVGKRISENIRLLSESMSSK